MTKMKRLNIDHIRERRYRMHYQRFAYMPEGLIWHEFTGLPLTPQSSLNMGTFPAMTEFLAGVPVPVMRNKTCQPN